MSIENKYYAEYNIIRPESKSWFKKAVDSVCKGFNDAINKVVDATRIAKNNPGPIAAAAIAAAVPNFAGCGDKYHLEQIDGGRDAAVQSDRPLDDGSFDGGDSTVVNPDADLDAQPTDAQMTDAQPDPDSGADAQVPVEICGQPGDEDGNGLEGCFDFTACAGYVDPSGWACDTTTPGLKIEWKCGDGQDNDGDGNIDCMDNNCEGHECNNDLGCTCVGGAEKETNCTDGIDNNGDGHSDLVDADCHTQTSVCDTTCPTVGTVCFTGCSGNCQPGTCNELNTCVRNDPTCP